MWRFPWMFWLVALFIFFLVTRRRRWERGMMRDGYSQHGSGPKVERELEGQRSYLDALESRIAQLEERLDFTERLLSGRREG
jgi:hypothetical protein